MSGSSATETWQEATVFLLAVVEVFTVPIYACVMWTENTVSNGKQDIFVCVWVALVRMFEADRGARERGG